MTDILGYISLGIISIFILLIILAAIFDGGTSEDCHEWEDKDD